MKYFILNLNFIIVLIFVPILVIGQKNIAIRDTFIFHAFNKKALEEYNKVDNYYTILLDDSYDKQDRQDALYLAKYYFQTGANIQDVWENKLIEEKAYLYFDKLLKVIETKKVFEKDRKLITDSISFKTAPSVQICKTKFGTNYDGEIIVAEKHSSSFVFKEKITNDTLLGIDNQKIFKKYSIRLYPANCVDNEYNFQFNDVNVITEKNVSEYKKLLEKDKEDVSDYTSAKIEQNIKNAIAEIPPDKLEQLKSERAEYIKKIEIIREDSIADFGKINFIDYLLPGVGHRKFDGRNPVKRYTTLAIYTGVFLAGSSFSIYNKVNSDKNYNLHKESKTFRNASEYYKEANKRHKMFVVGIGVVLTTYLTNSIHLNIKNSKQNSKLKNTKGNFLLDSPSDGSLGLSLNFKFQ